MKNILCKIQIYHTEPKTSNYIYTTVSFDQNVISFQNFDLILHLKDDLPVVYYIRMGLEMVTITYPRKHISISSKDFSDDDIRLLTELVFCKVRACLSTSNGFRNEINLCYSNESSLIKDIDCQRDFNSTEFNTTNVNSAKFGSKEFFTNFVKENSNCNENKTVSRTSYSTNDEFSNVLSEIRLDSNYQSNDKNNIDCNYNIEIKSHRKNKIKEINGIYTQYDNSHSSNKYPMINSSEKKTNPQSIVNSGIKTSSKVTSTIKNNKYASQRSIDASDLEDKLKSLVKHVDNFKSRSHASKSNSMNKSKQSSNLNSYNSAGNKLSSNEENVANAPLLVHQTNSKESNKDDCIERKLDFMNFNNTNNKVYPENHTKEEDKTNYNTVFNAFNFKILDFPINVNNSNEKDKNDLVQFENLSDEKEIKIRKPSMPNSNDKFKRNIRSEHESHEKDKLIKKAIILKSNEKLKLNLIQSEKILNENNFKDKYPNMPQTSFNNVDLTLKMRELEDFIDNTYKPHKCLNDLYYDNLLDQPLEYFYSRMHIHDDM